MLFYYTLVVAHGISRYKIIVSPVRMCTTVYYGLRSKYTASVTKGEIRGDKRILFMNNVSKRENMYTRRSKHYQRGRNCEAIYEIETVLFSAIFSSDQMEISQSQTSVKFCCVRTSTNIYFLTTIYKQLFGCCFTNAQVCSYLSSGKRIAHL